MKAASIMSSQVHAFGRMDAGFHLAVKEVESDVAKLEAAGMTAEIALERIAGLKGTLLEPLNPLLTGNGIRQAKREEYLKAAEKYPLIAYALLQRDQQKLADKAHAAIVEAQSALDAINELSAPIPGAKPRP